MNCLTIIERLKCNIENYLTKVSARVEWLVARRLITCMSLGSYKLVHERPILRDANSLLVY